MGGKGGMGRKRERSDDKREEWVEKDKRDERMDGRKRENGKRK